MRRARERLRSKARRDKRRAQLVDEILAEASHTSTVRILEYRPITVQTSEEQGGASRSSAIACEHAGQDHAELPALCSQDGAIVHVAVCDIPHPNGDGETQYSRNTVAYQDTTDTVPQQASGGSRLSLWRHDEASFVPQQETSLAKREQLHRNRKRNEQRRHSQGRVRVL